MKEHDVEQALVTAAKQRGGIAWKFTSPGTAGVPDRIILMPDGKTGFVELKAPGKKPRSLQLLRIRQLQRLGFKTFVIDDKKQISETLDEIEGGEAR